MEAFKLEIRNTNEINKEKKTQNTDKTNKTTYTSGLWNLAVAMQKHHQQAITSWRIKSK